MAQAIDSDPSALRAAMRGTLLEPGDPEYDEARKVWNAAIDGHPALIARPLSADDVATAVTYRCSTVSRSPCAVARTACRGRRPLTAA